MITCPNCNSDNSSKSKFCNRCGKPLPGSKPLQTHICPKCNLPISPTSRFCPNCGAVSQPLQQPEPGTQMIRTGDTCLVIRFPGGNTEKHDLIPGQKISLGRNPGNQIRINFPGVSGQHLELILMNDVLTVTDLDSTNGTEINGQKIRLKTPVSLRAGDIMRIRDGLGNSIAMNLDTGAPVSLRTRSLGMLNLAHVTNVLIIGRDPNSDLPLNHPTVSSQHAKLERRGSVLFIQDLGSTNGTFVNGKRIIQENLGAGDVVQIGPFKLVWDAQQQQLAKAVGLGHRLDALNLGLEVKKRKDIKDIFKASENFKIINKINMSIMPGEFVSLVGGSGAGKSTLLKALNGFTQANQGQMLLDGEEFYTRLDLYRSQMGYVPQDDIIHMDLPVDVALSYAAKLRLPGHANNEIERRVVEALKQVDMLEHRHKRVKVLSGGQRKRVSIAVELLAKPTMFFLDEPTSGLDPGLEKQMMQDLNKLADTGTTVVLVTHATANIEECDHVAFLDKGLLAYYGPPREALKFFDVMDFADIYRRLSAKINPGKGETPPKELQPYFQSVIDQRGPGEIPAGGLWAAHYRRSPQHKEFVSDRQQQLGTGQIHKPVSQHHSPRKSKDSFVRQTWILAQRQFDLIRNNWMMLVILLAMMPAIGLLFMAVSEKYDLTGWSGVLTDHQIDNMVLAELLCTDEEYDDIFTDLENVASTGYPRCVNDRLETVTYPNMEGGEDEALRIRPDQIGELKDKDSADYMPAVSGQTLVSMLGLAITQGGTFAAAYEIVKEKAIFKRERAVNLRVGSYVLSKVLVLAAFGLIQVVSVVLLLGIKLNTDLTSVFGILNGPWELMITLFLSILASIMFGLFISAAVSNQDIVIYLILAQLFAQIILSGTMFPMDDSPVMRATIANWAMDSMGSVVNIEGLNEDGRACGVTEQDLRRSDDPSLVVGCDKIAPLQLDLKYEFDEEHVLLAWMGLLVHTAIWGCLTFVVLYRRKGD